MDGFVEVVRWLLLKPDEAFSGWIVWAVAGGAVLAFVVLAWILLDLARAVLRRFRTAFCHVLGSFATVAALAVLLAVAKPLATRAMYGGSEGEGFFPEMPTDWIVHVGDWSKYVPGASEDHPFSRILFFWRGDVSDGEDEDPGDQMVPWVPEVPEVDAGLEETIRGMRDKAQVWRNRAIYLKGVADVWSEFWKTDERPSNG